MKSREKNKVTPESTEKPGYPSYEEGRLSRRGFFALIGAGAASAAISACGPTDNPFRTQGEPPAVRTGGIPRHPNPDQIAPPGSPPHPMPPKDGGAEQPNADKDDEGEPPKNTHASKEENKALLKKKIDEKSDQKPKKEPPQKTPGKPVRPTLPEKKIQVQ